MEIRGLVFSGPSPSPHTLDLRGKSSRCACMSCFISRQKLNFEKKWSYGCCPRHRRYVNCDQGGDRTQCLWGLTLYHHTRETPLHNCILQLQDGVQLFEGLQIAILTLNRVWQLFGTRLILRIGWFLDFLVLFSTFLVLWMAKNFRVERFEWNKGFDEWNMNIIIILLYCFVSIIWNLAL